MKRTLRVLLVTLAVAMALVVTMLGVMAAVTSEAVVYGDAVNLGEIDGNTFEVGFHFKNNNTDVEAGKINITWDAEKVSAEEIVAEGFLAENGVVFSKNIGSGKAVVAWAGSAIKSTDAEGDLFTITFDKSQIGDGGVAFNVEVESFGYTALFVPYNLAESVTAEAGYAATSSVSTYTGTTQAEAEAWLESIVGAAMFGDVTAEIGADLVFSSASKNTVIDIGSAGDVPGHTISFTSAGTDGDGNPYGFVLDKNTILNFYANLSFNNIKLKGAGAWSSGGTIQVSEGSAVFGVNDAEQSYGTIYTPSGDSNRVNLAGDNLEVYTGSYYSISANYYNTKREVDTPSIKVAGDVKATYAIGGSHNGGNTVTGESELVIDGSPTLSYVTGGSYSSNGVGSNGGTTTVNGTPTITRLAASICGAGNIPNNLYKLVVNGGDISYLCSVLFTEGKEATVKTEITLNGGSFGSIFAGGYSTGTGFGSKVFGTADLTIKVETEGNVYGGSYLRNAASVDGMDVTVTLNTEAFTKNVYGGSYIAVLGAEHQGNSTVQVSNGTTVSGTIYGGSNLGQAGTKHTGNSEVKVLGGSVSGTIYGGSAFPAADGDSYSSETNGKWGHFGNSGVVVEGGTITSSYVYGGSNMNAEAASIQTGYGVHGVEDTSETYVTITGGAFTGSSIYGGAHLGVANSVMYGDVAVTISGGTIKIAERIAAVHAEAAGSRFIGNSEVIITGSALIDNNGTDTSINVKGVMGGTYGDGTMTGDSSLEISGNGKIDNFGNYNSCYSVTGGCASQTNLDTSTTGLNRNNPYGGTRQTGNVSFVVKDNGSVRTRISATGYRSNISGNITIKVMDNAVIGEYLYGLCVRSANSTTGATGGYASVGGDMYVYFSGQPQFDYVACIGGNQSSNAPSAGYNTIIGKQYVEMKDFSPTTESDIYLGYRAASQNMYLKLIGNCQLSDVPMIAYTQYPQSADANYTRILDLTQYTGNLNSNGLPGNILGSSNSTTRSFETYEPLKDKNVTFATTELVAGNAMNSLVNGQNVTFGNTTVAYADLIAYDEYSTSPNAFKFYSAETDKEIINAGVLTRDIYVTAGTGAYAVASADIHFENAGIDATIGTVESKYTFKGNSIRPTAALALRCRAVISSSFLADHTNGNVNDGFSIKEIGILVSVNGQYTTSEMVLGGESITTAKAWENGAMSDKLTQSGGWMVEGDDYLFAAAVTNYTEARYASDVYFRPYMICEDVNGDTFVVYRDLSEYVKDSEGNPVETPVTTVTESGATIVVEDGFTQYYTSLYKRASYDKNNNTDTYKDYKAVIDAITNYVDNPTA